MNHRSVQFAVALLTLLALVSSATASALHDDVNTWRKAHEREIFTDFCALLAMPNVATTVPDVEKNATYIEERLRQRGFKTRLLRAEPGTPPSVFAELPVRGARRTVVFYAHYDGQPIGQKGWDLGPVPAFSAHAAAGSEAR